MCKKMESNEFSENTNLKFAVDKGFNETKEAFQAVALLPVLKNLFAEMIRGEICSIRMYQTKLKCYLEIAEDVVIHDPNIYKDDDLMPDQYKNYSKIDRIIRRDDLEHITEDEKMFFNPLHSIEHNASTFLNMLNYPENCLGLFSEIFSEQGIQELKERSDL